MASSTLYVVPTPIGNLKDITLRALEVLRQVPWIAAEDTRRAKILIDTYELGEKRLIALHAHNEHKVAKQIIAQMKANAVDVAVITDAGTPGVSDPGFLIIRAAYEAEVSVEVLPGPTAFVPALLFSNLPAHRFCFEGFLPVKKHRKKRLQALAQEERTMIFYESPHRLVKTLKDLVAYLGSERPAAVCKELTKIHQTIQRGTLQQLLHYYENQTTIKGEFVLVVAGKS